MLNDPIMLSMCKEVMFLPSKHETCAVMRRQWPGIKPTLFQYVVFAGLVLSNMVENPASDKKNRKKV